MRPSERRRPRLPLEGQLERAIRDAEAEIAAINDRLDALRVELAGLGRLANMFDHTTPEELHELACAALSAAFQDVRCRPAGFEGPNASLLSRGDGEAAILVTTTDSDGATFRVLADGYAARARMGRSSSLPVVLVVGVAVTSEGSGLDRARVPVADAVAEDARRAGILLLRAFDLWQLVAEQQSGGDVDEVFWDAARAGGWLRVEGRPELRPR